MTERSLGKNQATKAKGVLLAGLREGRALLWNRRGLILAIPSSELQKVLKFLETSAESKPNRAHGLLQLKGFNRLVLVTV